MNLTKQMIKQTALAAAITASLGTAIIPGQASALNLVFNVSGWFTMIDAAGTGALTNSDATSNAMYGRRTAVSGTMTFDTTTNIGSFTLQPFSFFGSGYAAAAAITFRDEDGPGGASTLMLGNMGFDWNNNNGIPVSIAWDGKGLLDYISQGAPANYTVGETIASTGTADFSCASNISCSTPATDSFLFNFGKQNYTLPIGASPITTATFNTTDIGTISLGTNPSGTLPFIADTIGGSPMKAGPFPGFNANFDFVSLTLTSDGSGSITAPPAASDTIPETLPLPANSPLALGAPSNVAPAGTAEYCTDGSVSACNTNNAWIADNGTNTINVPITQTNNVVSVDWRAGGGVAFATQTATVTVDDQTAPVIDSTNAPNISTSVNSTADNVCFGAISATDAVEPNLTLEWSHDGFNWNPANPDTGNLTDNCSTGFGPNSNTITWRVTDVAGNPATYQQTVTLNLPTGIVGKACTVDLATAGSRLLEGRFTMRTSTGAVTGTIDDLVDGNIDTTVFCTDPDLADCNPVPSAAALTAGQPFFGFIWTADPVRLFGPGTWTFETCPFPRSFDASSNDWESPDGSNKCVLSTDPTFSTDGSAPNPLTMTVGPGQVGAHMLFEWAGNEAIDVAVVWDADCNEFELTATDPDGDGILASRMVDGPFKGFNAAFDVSTVAGEPPIADGGYTTTIPVVQNPVSRSSPLPLAATNPVPAVTDPAAVRSCVGDCFDFTTTQLRSATDGAGNYQYAQVVLPLSEAIPFWSQYRKFDTVAQTWGPYTIDSRNDVKTAPLDVSTGGCPEPGNGTYDRPITGALPDKLREDDECVQLTIEDGGANDADGAVNGSVSDPGGVVEVPAVPLPETATGGGGCSVTTGRENPGQHSEWWLLAGLLGYLGWRRKQRS